MLRFATHPTGRTRWTIDLFRMERYQSLYWHQVDYDLSESGVSPMTIRELLGPAADAEAFLAHELGYPLSEGSCETRANVAAWYPGATAENVTMVNGGSEANFLSLWALARARRPARVHGAQLHAGVGPRSALRRGRPTRFRLQLARRTVGARPRRARTTRSTSAPRSSWSATRTTPPAHVLTEEEMDAVVRAADRVGAWIVADEIYRGAELDTDVATPTFFGPLRAGDRDERAVEGVRDARPARRAGSSRRRR